MNHRKMLSILGIASISILVLAVPAVSAHDFPSGTVDSSNRIVFTTGALTGVFEGNVPHVTFYATSDMGRTQYKVNFRALVEFLPASSSDGAFQTPTEVARADLDSGTWTHSDFYPVKDTTGTTIGIGFNFTQAGPIQIAMEHGGTSPPLATNSLAFAVKAFNSSKIITVNGQDVTINTAEIKIDVVISNYPFVSQNDKLALQVNMQSSFDHFGLDEGTGSHEVDSSTPEASSIIEHDFHTTSDQDQNIRFTSGMLSTTSTTGFFRFVKTATVTSPSGQTSTVNVAAAFKSESEREGGEMQNFFKLYLAYPYFQGTLVHDPSIGITGGGIPTLYLVAGGAAAAGLVSVVVIRKRHPKVTVDTTPK